MKLSLRHARSGRSFEFTPRSLLVAGFTGRDREAVAAHIAELESAGVRCPSETPVFYPLAGALVTDEAAIAVGGSATSGEVEPVLFCIDGQRYIGVGSDHTDRELERRDIAESKAACPKVVGPDLIDYEEALDGWERLRLRSSTGGGELYQEGTAGELMSVPEIVAVMRDHGHELADGDVLFLGTLPLKNGSFVFSDRWAMELEAPGGPVMRCSYEVSH